LLRAARVDTGVRKMRHLIAALAALAGVLLLAAQAKGF
jgi:hypothetical protein